jgi:hypothetical protein
MHNKPKRQDMQMDDEVLEGRGEISIPLDASPQPEGENALLRIILAISRATSPCVPEEVDGFNCELPMNRR